MVNEKGSVKVFFVIFMLVALAYVGISFGKPYYRYNTLRSFSRDTILMEVGDTKVIRKKILDEAAVLKVPLDEEDLSISINDHKIIVVKANWSEVVDFWGYYQKRLDFDMNVEG